MRYVEWVDSTTECGTPWHDRDEAVKACSEMTESDMICKSCGFLLWEDDKIMVLTSSHHGGEVGPYLTIPVECIRKTRKITIAEGQ